MRSPRDLRCASRVLSFFVLLVAAASPRWSSAARCLAISVHGEPVHRESVARAVAENLTFVPGVAVSFVSEDRATAFREAEEAGCNRLLRATIDADVGLASLEILESGAQAEPIARTLVRLEEIANESSSVGGLLEAAGFVQGAKVVVDLPTGARATLDSAIPLDGEVLVEAGEHAVTIELEGFERELVHVSLARRSTNRVVALFEEQPAAPGFFPVLLRRASKFVLTSNVFLGIGDEILGSGLVVAFSYPMGRDVRVEVHWSTGLVTRNGDTRVAFSNPTPRVRVNFGPVWFSAATSAPITGFDRSAAAFTAAGLFSHGFTRALEYHRNFGVSSVFGASTDQRSGFWTELQIGAVGFPTQPWIGAVAQLELGFNLDPVRLVFGVDGLVGPEDDRIVSGPQVCVAQDPRKCDEGPSGLERGGQFLVASRSVLFSIEVLSLQVRASSGVRFDASVRVVPVDDLSVGFLTGLIFDI